MQPYDVFKVYLFFSIVLKSLQKNPIKKLQHGTALIKIYYFQILVHSHMASSHDGQNELQGLLKKQGMPVRAIDFEASS